MAYDELANVMGGGIPGVQTTATSEMPLLGKLGWLMTQLSAIPSAFGGVPNPAPEIGNALAGAKGAQRAYMRGQGQPQQGETAQVPVPSALQTPVQSPAPASTTPVSTVSAMGEPVTPPAPAPSLGAPNPTTGPLQNPPNFLEQSVSVPMSYLLTGKWDPKSLSGSMTTGGTSPNLRPSNAPAQAAPATGVAPQVAPQAQPAQMPAPQTAAAMATGGTAPPMAAPDWFDFAGMTPQMLSTAETAGREARLLPTAESLVKAQTARQLTQAMLDQAQTQAIPGRLDLQREKQASDLERAAGKLDVERSKLELGRDKLAMGLELKQSKLDMDREKLDIERMKAENKNTLETERRAQADRALDIKQAYNEVNLKLREMDIEGRLSSAKDSIKVRRLDELRKENANIALLHPLGYEGLIKNAFPSDKKLIGSETQTRSKAMVERFDANTKSMQKLMDDLESGAAAPASKASSPPAGWLQKMYRGNVIFVSPDGSQAWHNGKTATANSVDSLFNQ